MRRSPNQQRKAHELFVNKRLEHWFSVVAVSHRGHHDSITYDTKNDDMLVFSNRLQSGNEQFLVKIWVGRFAWSHKVRKRENKWRATAFRAIEPFSLVCCYLCHQYKVDTEYTITDKFYDFFACAAAIIASMSLQAFSCFWSEKWAGAHFKKSRSRTKRIYRWRWRWRWR